MKILFVHQNYPGQFLRLAPELERRGHEVVVLTDDKNANKTAQRSYRYRHTAERADPATTRLGRTFIETSDRGVTAARAALTLRDQHGFTPDVIFGHSGWGETLFLKEIWPDAKLIIYAEFFYRARGADVGFDPEFSRPTFEQSVIANARNAHLGLSLLNADAALAPTRWQHSTFPPQLRPMIEVIFDGVDTDLLVPKADARLKLPDGPEIATGDEVLTFINRNLEPYRGYHSFIRALPAVLEARPNAQVVLIGGDGVSYGGAAPEGTTWKEHFLNEVRDRLDMSRVHFLGKVPYSDFVKLMQITRVHAYLTYPFVLSWSMLEAMSAGAHVVASRTAPVEELITDGVNGELVDFFDIAGWSEALIRGLADPTRADPLRRAARETILHGGYDLKRHCLPRIANFVEDVGRGTWSPSQR